MLSVREISRYIRRDKAVPLGAVLLYCGTEKCIYAFVNPALSDSPHLLNQETVKGGKVRDDLLISS
jgi:hypothetical protein